MEAAGLYLGGAVAVFQKAVRAGGTVVQEPKQQDDPDKRGGVTDPTGITWWIASQVS